MFGDTTRQAGSEVDPGKFRFDYTINKVKVDDSKFYQLLRTGDDFSKDKGMDLWSGKPGTKGHKEFTARLNDSDYRLILGVHFGGALRIENLKIEDASPAPLPAGVIVGSPLVPDERLVLQGGAEIKNGGVEIDTTGNEWNEYLYTASDTLAFEAGKSYKISYDYAVSKADANAQLYHLFRTGTGEDNSKDLCWEAWDTKAGDKGHKEFIAAPAEAGYRLIIGLHFGGAVRIENLKIEDLSKKK